MLYDYHAYQNKEKPDSIHATYLISGRKRAVKAENGGDVEMSSSMPDQEEPHSEDIPTTTLTLVGEEKLQGRPSSLNVAAKSPANSRIDTLAGYEDATCIHIYSLAPHPQRDLALLSDMSKALSEYSIKEQEPKYGAIVNHHVRRRDKAARTKAATPSSSKPAKTQPSSVKSAPSAEKVKQEPSATKVKQELAPEPPKEGTQSSNVSKPPPSTNRGAPGGIMQSFAKAASKPPKPKPQPKEEGTSMALSDDGEADDEDIIPSKKTDKDNDTGRKSRKEREEELRRMMEEDEDEDEDEEDDESKERGDEEEAADQEMEEAPDPEPEAASQDKQSNEPPEVVASTENGRRRGKRRVMQKKRILDDQGYMGLFPPIPA